MELNSFIAHAALAACVGVTLVTGKAGAAEVGQSARRATVEERSFIFLGAPKSWAALVGGQYRGPGLAGEHYTGSGWAIVRTHPKV